MQPKRRDADRGLLLHKFFHPLDDFWRLSGDLFHQTFKLVPGPD
jgi:hypothetical protein